MKDKEMKMHIMWVLYVLTIENPIFKPIRMLTTISEWPANFFWQKLGSQQGLGVSDNSSNSDAAQTSCSVHVKTVDYRTAPSFSLFNCLGKREGGKKKNMNGCTRHSCTSEE